MDGEDATKKGKLSQRRKCSCRVGKLLLSNEDSMRRIVDVLKQGVVASFRCSGNVDNRFRICGLRSNFPESILCKYPATALQQPQQIRWFVAKVKYSMKGFGPNGTALKLCFCYNEHDLFAKPKTYIHEKYQYFKSRCVLSEIQEKTKEEFDTCEDLEFYNDTKWVPLTDVKVLKPWKGGEKVLNIRVPSRWDDLIHEFDIINPYEKYMTDPKNVHDFYDMKEVVDTLVLACKLTDMVRSKIKPYHLQQSDKKEIATKQWLLNEAEHDKLLRSIILRKPGTLDHIVQCLHYDFVWRKLKDADPKVHPSNENQVQYGNISRSYSVR